MTANRAQRVIVDRVADAIAEEVADLEEVVGGNAGWERAAARAAIAELQALGLLDLPENGSPHVPETEHWGVAEFYCDDRVSMRQSEARPSSGRRGRPPVSADIDMCLCCGERLPGEGGTFSRAKAHGWRRRYHGNGNRFVCPGCP